MITNYLDEIITCPKCGEVNNWRFVMYYGDECFKCDYDIRTHIRNKSYFEDRRKKFEELLNELYKLKPENDEHKERFCQIEEGLLFILENTDRHLKRIENFDLIGLC